MKYSGTTEQDIARAASDEQAMEHLVAKHEGFILRCASQAAHRPVTRQDDEWSAALAAFVQTVKAYRPGKGSLWGFAQMVIYRRIADHYRSAARFSAEIPAAPSVFESGPLEDSDQPQLQAAVSRRLAACSDSPCLSEKIDAANLTLARYGFDFFSLVSCSPKAEKTKAACAAAVNCLLDTPALLAEMRLGKTLPAKSIEKISEVPRKILERHRRYIIAAAEILSGEYPSIARYLRYIREGKDR